jgi:hypothetical protein
MIHPSIDFLWRPGYVYCWGPGPTKFTGLYTDKVQLKTGETVTISGSAVDLSPYATGVPAVNMPVHLTYTGPDNVRQDIATVYTDKDGSFSYTWDTWVEGTLSIRAESAGNAAYEAPDNIYWPIYVSPSFSMVPVLEGIIVILIVVAIALPIIVYAIRKPKPYTRHKL